MQHKLPPVSPIEKIISSLSYLSMGIVGMFWIILAYSMKRTLRYFLMYNIAQSMLISIFYAIICMVGYIIFKITEIIPFLKYISASINFFISVKIVSILGFSLSILQLILFLLFMYIISGIIVGRIFYVPFLSQIMTKAMNSHK